MADLKPALCSMSELDSAELPTGAGLETFLAEAFAHAEKLLNSLPNPASDDAATPTDLKLPGSVTKAAETLVDAASIPAAAVPRGSDPADQKKWAKPLKLNAKDNPLRVNVYKMAAHDRHGAWFARRSVHTGIGYERMRRCMQREFLDSLKVKGGPGSGAVRGIAGDRRLERHRADGTGAVEVWQLSSAFPGPVTPREFITLVVTGDNCLSLESAPASSDQIPRGYITISRPSVHPEGQPRSGLVKGTYESMEMVREIPLFPDDRDRNPVEWTMITRSEPGGGIPKFLVERGTPGSIVADVAKWLQWAIDKGDLPELDDAAAEQEEAEAAAAAAAESAESESAEQGHDSDSTVDAARSAPRTDGAADSAAKPAATGTSGGPLGYLAMASNYVQEKASGYLPYFGNGRVSPASSDDTSSLDEAGDNDDDDAETASFRSFDELTVADSKNGRIKKLAGEKGDIEVASIQSSQTPGATPSASTEALIADIESRADGHLNHNERELLKLSEKRRQLDDKINKSREADNARAQEITSKEAAEQQKAAERHEREVQRQEKRYREQLQKLERAREKEAQKIEDRRRKAYERDELRIARAQRDEWRERYKVVEQENDILRRQVEGLQRENTALAAGLGELGAPGQDLARKARLESLGDRAASTKSRASSETSPRNKSPEAKSAAPSIKG